MNLTIKYRPESFEQVLGQEAVIKSLQEVIKRDNKLPPCLLFSGSAGLGKTTLARIAAREVGCDNGDGSIIEINGAEKTSIDDMREVLDLVSFVPFGKNKNRAIIIDEAHRLSKQAWDSLLKPTEEPVVGSSWIFCSTEPEKIPKAILTRCVPPSGYILKKVASAKIKEMLKFIVEKESFPIDNNILNLITIKSDGSPRQAIKWLEALHNETSLTSAQELLKSIESGDEVPAILALCRALHSQKPWATVLATLKDSEEEAEAIRTAVLRYFALVVMRAKSTDETEHALKIINAFSKPYHPAEKMAPLLLSLGMILL